MGGLLWCYKKQIVILQLISTEDVTIPSGTTDGLSTGTNAQSVQVIQIDHANGGGG